jgi:hypothetical protein
VNFYFSVAVLAVRRECQETIGKYTGKHITEIITVLCNLRQLQEKKYKISITEVTTIFFFLYLRHISSTGDNTIKRSNICFI